MRIAAEERVKLAVSTEAVVNDDMVIRCSNKETIRLLHAAIGIATEAGELLDSIKKHIFYGKPLDKANILEEMGDIDWYMNLLCDLLKVTMKEVEELNIRKLHVRYKDGFSEQEALSRDLKGEGFIFEGFEK